MPNARPVCFYTDTDESESLVIQLHIKKRRGDRERKDWLWHPFSHLLIERRNKKFPLGKHAATSGTRTGCEEQSII